MNTEKIREALAELVELKRIKDTDGKTDDYERRQPLAWEAAREALLTPEAVEGELTLERVCQGLKGVAGYLAAHGYAPTAINDALTYLIKLKSESQSLTKQLEGHEGVMRKVVADYDYRESHPGFRNYDDPENMESVRARLKAKGDAS